MTQHDETRHSQTRHDETRHDPAAVQLPRRHLLRGGAVLAGAAGVSALSALQPSVARAADGDPVVLGASNDATSTTTVTATTGNDPALSLVNPLGPTLRLTPVDVDWEGDLVAGDLVGTASGPLVGVDYGDGLDYLVTGNDLATLGAVPEAEQRRLLNTRDARYRSAIPRTSSGALDERGRLRAGAWIDVAVVAADQGMEMSAAFLNVAVIDPTKNGYLTVHPPGRRPNVSTINFRAGVDLANAAFVGLSEVVDRSYVVRIYTTQTTHILLDLSGFVSSESPLVTQQSPALKLRSARQAKRAALVKRSLERTGS